MGSRRWSSCAVMVVSGSLACAVACSHGKSLAPAQSSLAEIELVHVKGGCFRMGNTFEAGGPEEKPVHEVCVDDFDIGKYEVTRVQWQATMGSAAPAIGANCTDVCPVERISWDDAQAFIARLNARRGGAGSPSGQYRLPTEAEWEYAARSGGKDERYAGPSTDVDSIAWHFWNGGVTQEVGLKAPNGLGLYDMSGNVWEWTGDWYGETYYSTSPRVNPTGPSSGEHRVLRGGSAACPPFDLQATYRNHLPPGYRGEGKGFRVVRTVPTKAR